MWRPMVADLEKDLNSSCAVVEPCQIAGNFFAAEVKVKATARDLASKMHL